VISYTLYLQRRQLTRMLGKHRLKPVHDCPTVTDPGGSVDNQQDSLGCWHRVLSHLLF
jgi:hypothetical protein